MSKDIILRSDYLKVVNIHNKTKAKGFELVKKNDVIRLHITAEKYQHYSMYFELEINGEIYETMISQAMIHRFVNRYI